MGESAGQPPVVRVLRADLTALTAARTRATHPAAQHHMAAFVADSIIVRGSAPRFARLNEIPQRNQYASQEATVRTQSGAASNRVPLVGRATTTVTTARIPKTGAANGPMTNASSDGLTG